MPSCLKDGRAHSIRAKVKGSSYYLWNCPLELTCTPRDPETYELRISLTRRLWGSIIDNTLRDSDNPYLGLVVRSDVVTRPDQFSNMEQTLEYLLCV